MRLIPWASFVALLFLPVLLHGQCVNDRRSNRNAGILIGDSAITGTQCISATELASVASELIGSCFDEDSEELEQEIRTAFQDHGYFAAKVNSLGFKPHDPLGVPKPVILEADVSDGPRYKLAEITFVENHAFSSAELRDQFQLKRGDVIERAKIAGGLMGLRKLYRSRGFLDWAAVPDVQFASNATATLGVSLREGTQYHLQKLDIVADKEIAARLRAEWKLADGEVYDDSYVDQYVELNRNLLPSGFDKASIQRIQNCPDGVVEVRLLIDPAEDPLHTVPKNVPCKEQQDVSK
jgi:outer membrane protein assembly factor BamA